MEDIRTMLDRVASGELSVDQAVLELKKEPFSEAGFDELGFAKLDTHRRLRQGIAEVIYGSGKNSGADRRDRGGDEKARPGTGPDHTDGPGKGPSYGRSPETEV